MSSRIALLARHARPWGGIERHVRDLAWGLSGRGHRALLFHEQRGRDPAWCEPFAAVHDLDGCSPAAALERVLSARPDVVYAHKWEDPRLVAALARRLPLVLMVHDHDLTCPRRHRYTLLGRRECTRPMGWGCLGCLPTLERVPGTRRLGWRPWSPRLGWLRLLRALPSLVVASQSMREELTLNGVDPSRVEVIPPVPADEVPPEPAPYPGAPEVLFVGQVVRTKGWDLLLDAWERLPDPPRLTIAGDGNDLPLLRARLAASRLAGRVETPGWLDPAALAARYRQAGVVVVPSRWQEPFGLVGLEAMAWARPVVAFAVGGIPSWLEHGHTGLLVPPGDPGALARALATVLADPARAAAMGRAGHRLRLERLRFGACLDRVEELLGRATAGAAVAA